MSDDCSRSPSDSELSTAMQTRRGHTDLEDIGGTPTGNDTELNAGNRSGTIRPAEGSLPSHASTKEPSPEYSAAPPRSRTTSSAGQEDSTQRSCCVETSRKLEEERARRRALEDKVARLTREVQSLREQGRDESKLKILEATTESGDQAERMTELQVEVLRLKQLLEEREKDLAAKEERIHLLQEKLVDQLLAVGGEKPSAAKTPKKRVATTGAVRARTPMSSSNLFSRNASPAGFVRSSTGSSVLSARHGPSPAARPTTRRAPLVSSSPTGTAPVKKPLFSGVSGRGTTPRETGTPVRSRGPAKPAPPLNASALSSARRTASSGNKLGSTASISSTGTAPTTAREGTPVRAVRRAGSTPSRGHPVVLPPPPGGMGHPGSAGLQQNLRARSRSTSVGATAASSKTSVRAPTPLQSTPTRVMQARSVYSGEASRQRPRISCSVGRNDTTVLKGTTTTVTFKRAARTLSTSTGQFSADESEMTASATFEPMHAPVCPSQGTGNQDELSEAGEDRYF